MNVQEIYLLCTWLSDKYQSRQISDAEFNYAMQAASLDLWKKKVGLPEEYQVNAPFARQAWQVSNKISDDMRYFITEAAITKNVSTGIFAYPADYGAFSSLRYRRVLNQPNCEDPSVATRTVELVTDAELSERLDNTVIPPDFEYPVGAWYATGWKVFPSLITSVNLTYLRLPTTPYRNYVLDPVTDLTQYDPIGSVQLDFPTTLHIDFAYLVLKQFAINIREEELYQYAAQRQNSGQ